MKDISVSILNVEDLDTFFNNYNRSIETLKKNSKIRDGLFESIIHFDVMDNKFVPNTGIDIEKIKIVKQYNFYIDTHLMVEKPIEDGYIDKAIEYGSNDITIHIEISNFDKALLYLIEKKKSSNIKIGISLKPNTDIERLEEYIDKVDKILFMTVEPGFGGQMYIEEVNNKIATLKKKYPSIRVQIDGGVNNKTISVPLREGVESFVVGSYLTKSNDEIYDKLCILNATKGIEELPREADIDFENRICNIVSGGYGEGDILLGIRVPRVRDLARCWKKNMSMNSTETFITSKYHDYRRFGIFILNENVGINNKDEVKAIIDKNVEHINNWDLVDSLAPVCIGAQLINESDTFVYKVLREYTISNDIWIKRIGIVSLLHFAKVERKELIFRVIDDVIFEDFHLYQKASGWVLRELYKRCPEDTLEYLIYKNNIRKLPGILKSYACEKMSLEEKSKLRQ